MDWEVFQVFLDHLAEETDQRRIVLVLDDAGWHQTKSLNWHNISRCICRPIRRI